MQVRTGGSNSARGTNREERLRRERDGWMDGRRYAEERVCVFVCV